MDLDKVSSRTDKQPTTSMRAHMKFMLDSSENSSTEMLRKLLVGLLESFPVTFLVLALVVLQMYFISEKIESPTFEVFTTVFFTIEVMLKLYGLGLRGFFVHLKRWRSAGRNPVKVLRAVRYLNIIDFIVVMLDLFVIILMSLKANIPYIGPYVKTLRSARVLKMAKLARVFRLCKILKVFFEVLTRQPTRFVVLRRHDVRWKVASSDWKTSEDYAFHQKEGVDLEAEDRYSNKERQKAKTKSIGKEERHKFQQAWMKEVRKTRREGDRLVRKRVNKRSGIPIIGSLGGTNVSYLASAHKLCETFGVAVGMYFWSLRVFAVMFLVIMVIHLNTVIYFANHFQAQGNQTQTTLSTLLRDNVNFVDQNFTGTIVNIQAISTVGKQNLMHGTATCFRTNQVWALPSNYNSTSRDVGMSFLESRNDCVLGAGTVYSSAAVLLVLVCFYVFFQLQFKRMLSAVIATRQSTTDFSVMINDPNNDSYGTEYKEALMRPETWRKYCEKAAGGKVAGVTVLLDNSDLLDALVTRKKYAYELETLKRMNSTKKLEKQIEDMEMKYRKNECALHHHMKQQYRVSKVFVTFFQEKHQRSFLKEYSQGQAATMLDMSLDLPKRKWFLEKKILDVREPPEPESILYKNIGLTTPDRRRIQQLVVTSCVLLIAWLEYKMVEAMTATPGLQALAGGLIASMNAVVPSVLFFLSSCFEIHETEAQRISALFNKDSIFRYFNTAWIIYLLTPFDEVLHYERLYRVQAILFFDAFLTPLTHLFDINRMFQRKIVSRLTKSHYVLTTIFSGDAIRLSERYSSLAKTIFVGLFYLPLIPTGAILAAIGCGLTFFIDKFGLLFRWRWLPRSNGLELFWSLTVHIAAAILVHTYMAFRFFAGWSYDRVCQLESPVTLNTMVSSSNSSTVDAVTFEWVQCNKQPGNWQDFMSSSKDTFFKMSPVQGTLVELYKWSFMTMVVLVGLNFLKVFSATILKFFFPYYKERGEAQEVPWNQVPGCKLYVPQFQVPGCKKPYLCVDCDPHKFGVHHIGSQWNNTEDAISHSLYTEAKPLMDKLGITQNIFSQTVQFVQEASSKGSDSSLLKLKKTKLDKMVV